MSTPVARFVDEIDGVRGGVADAIAQQFATVADLSEADPDTLVEVRGVGPVLAERILSAARTAVIAGHTPDEEPDPAPDTRARAQVAQARASTRPSLDVIEGDVEGDAEPPEGQQTTAVPRQEQVDREPDVPEADVSEPDVQEPDDGTSLSPIVERLAYLLGTSIGWSIRLVRSATLPVRSLLHRG